MPRPVRHVFVCENLRAAGDPKGCCAEKGAARVREAFKLAIEQRGLRGRVRANLAGCLGQCASGVSVVVYPEGIWYGGVKPEDVPEIVDAHLVGGRPVERLVMPHMRE